MFSMANRKYDLIVIGSGPAGEKGAAQAAYFGKKVAIIEKEPVLGGAATNTGTLPSKTLRESALYLSGFNQRGLFGIDTKLKDKVTADDFLYREKLVVQSERSRIAKNINHHKIDLIHGNAYFIDEHTIEIMSKGGKPDRIFGEFILIAVGSYPFRPFNFPFDDPRVFDSDTILHIGEMPDSMLIAGGGVIGCEYACMFAALGIKIHLVESRKTLLSFLDSEISQRLEKSMQAMGINLLLSSEIKSVQALDKIEVQLANDELIEVETLLAATGRNGNTENLGVRDIGLNVCKRGYLGVNQKYQTDIRHIYAVGDVIGFPALASTAMEQARIAMVHAFHLEYKIELATVLPFGIYTIPECSVAGKTEQELAKENVSYIVGRADFSENARGQIIGEEDGLLKLLFRKNDMKLLGVHIIGESASELIHVGLTALLLGANAELFIQTCYNYPTLTEVYKYATYDALGNLANNMYTLK
jgi:NAD(P) transhydrogenase